MKDNMMIGMSALGMFLLCDNLGILRAIRKIVTSYAGVE